MEHYKELMKELKEKGKEDVRNKGIKLRTEEAILKDLIIHNKGTCPKCGSENNLTLDHIIPEDILVQFGFERSKDMLPNNYQLLCRRCNQFKSNRLDFSNSHTKELLKSLIDNL